ncbi:MAG: hypothetical protein PHF84_07295, partial [bacterium]|nr:hypothetical protein [bacterium]
MKSKILILSLLLLYGCATQEVHPPSVTTEPPPATDLKDIHKGMTGNFIFYVSRAETDGDIWLYNFDSNSKWKITSEDNAGIEVVSYSPEYRFIIHTDNIVLNLKEDEKMGFYSWDEKKVLIPRISSVNWDTAEKFYFLSATNGSATNIFTARYKDEEEWSLDKISFDEYYYLKGKSIYGLSLSWNKNLLAFISRDEYNQLNIFIYNIQKQKVKKLVIIKNLTGMIWSERDDTLFYYEDYYIYAINLR